MQVKQIYKNYLTPKNLQNHMLQVASLAKIICNHWTDEKLEQQIVVQACLFHDIAKPMTSNLDKQAQFGISPKDIQKLKKLQSRIKTKYGTDEHHATVKICQEINLHLIAIKIVDNLEWKYIPRLLKNNDIKSLIPIYSDMRIGPKNLTSLLTSPTTTHTQH